MKRLHGSLAVIVLLSLMACSPRPAVDRSGLVAPLPTATTAPPPGAPQVAILSPLYIDSDDGRLYATGQVNGRPKLLVLDAADGALLAAWDTLGGLALDAARDRLVVDQGRGGLALLDAATGEVTATVELPAQDAPPAPQIDTVTGLVYAFRAATVYVIDPAIPDIIQATPLTVAHTVCDEPAGDAPIRQTAYDSSAGRLYLSFITYNCIPWVSQTLIAYDGRDLTETGRHDIDIVAQFAPHDGRLFGVSVSRLGPALAWSWDGAAEWLETSGDFSGGPAGMAVDQERGLVYEALGETLRVIDPNGRAVVSETAVPLLAGSALAGHDAGHDQLYFVSPAGRLSLWPAANLFDAPSPPVAAPSALPNAPVTWLALSPNWGDDGSMLALVEDNACPAAGGALFVLLDAEAGWKPASPDTTDGCATVTAAAFSPDYARDSLLFAATAEPTTVLRSVDGGRSWTAAETPFAPGVVRALLPSPTYGADQTIFALLDDGALHRSRDGGRTWRGMGQRLDRLAVLDAAGPKLDLYGAAGGQLLRSDDGETWTPVGPTPDAETLLLLAAVPSAGPRPVLFAFTAGGRFARSLDGGLSWTTVVETTAAPVQLALADGPDETRPVFLLHHKAIMASYDGMSSVWAATATDEAGRYRPTAIALPPAFAAAPYLFVGTVDGQVLRVRADSRP
jgi:DNA-binding beta-propeller fold protein YncE